MQPTTSFGNDPSGSSTHAPMLLTYRETLQVSGGMSRYEAGMALTTFGTAVAMGALMGGMAAGPGGMIVGALLGAARGAVVGGVAGLVGGAVSLRLRTSSH